MGRVDDKEEDEVVVSSQVCLKIQSAGGAKRFLSTGFGTTFIRHVG